MPKLFKKSNKTKGDASFKKYNKYIRCGNFPANGFLKEMFNEIAEIQELSQKNIFI